MNIVSNKKDLKTFCKCSSYKELFVNYVTSYVKGGNGAEKLLILFETSIFPEVGEIAKIGV